MIWAAAGGSGFTLDPTVKEVIFVLVGIAVLFVFIVASRLIARFAADQLRKRHVRSDLVVVSRRIITIVFILSGILAAIAFAVESANVVLFGILLATLVAALGVQDLLKDYVSGYYVQLERHVRIGDRISSDVWGGTVTEIRFRVTLLKSDTGDLIIVPNSELFTKALTVHSAGAVERAAKPNPPE
jgi:small-conductance mechanosensitive channel